MSSSSSSSLSSSSSSSSSSISSSRGGSPKRSHALQLGFQDNWLITPEQLRDETPSRFDGLSYEEEMHLRTQACFHVDRIRNCRRGSESTPMHDFIKQHVVSTAKLLLHRFYTQHSFKTHPYEDVALAALFLAAKVEDRPVKVVTLLNKFFLLQDPEHQDYLERSRDQEYLDVRTRMLQYERIILHTLSFNVTYSVGQQEKVLRSLASVLFQRGRDSSKEQRKSFLSKAHTFLNDSFNSAAALLFPAEKIAGAMCYLGLRLHEQTRQQRRLPQQQGQAAAEGGAAAAADAAGGSSASAGPAAWKKFGGATQHEITQICELMFSLYDAKSLQSGKTSEAITNLRRRVQGELGSVKNGHGGGGGGGGGKDGGGSEDSGGSEGAAAAATAAAGRSRPGGAGAGAKRARREGGS